MGEALCFKYILPMQKMVMMSDMWNLMNQRMRKCFQDYSRKVAGLHWSLYPFFLRSSVENYVIKDKKDRRVGEFCISTEKLQAAYDECLQFAKKYLYPIVESLIEKTEEVYLSADMKSKKEVRLSHDSRKLMLSIRMKEVQQQVQQQNSRRFSKSRKCKMKEESKNELDEL